MNSNLLSISAIFISLSMFSSLVKGDVIKSSVISQTYEIAEQDLLALVKQRAGRINLPDLVLKVARYEVPSVELPKAQEPTETMHQMRYKSEFDVTDQNGKVIYPKGFTYNPLRSVNIGRRIVVLAESQIPWMRSHLKPTDVVLISGGSIKRSTQTLNRVTYPLTQAWIDRFNLKEIPTIIEQHDHQVSLVTLIQDELQNDLNEPEA